MGMPRTLRLLSNETSHCQALERDRHHGSMETNQRLWKDCPHCNAMVYARSVTWSVPDEPRTIKGTRDANITCQRPRLTRGTSIATAILFTSLRRKRRAVGEYLRVDDSARREAGMMKCTFRWLPPTNWSRAMGLLQFNTFQCRLVAQPGTADLDCQLGHDVARTTSPVTLLQRTNQSIIPLPYECPPAG